MIWAAMSSAGVGPLCFLKSTVNAAVYQDIFEHFMLPSADKLYGDADFIFQQWWSVTKYNYFVTVLKYIFQVSVLYWSSFILSDFYFYFTTFQSIRSYFLLHYI